MSISEALAEGGQTAVIGLGTVFSVLIILMIVLFIMKLVFYRDGSKKAKETPVPVRTETEPEAAAVSQQTEETDDEELIAVLTAAIAASLNTSTYNLKIRSYRRTDGTKSVWQKTGITDTINSRF